MYLFFDTETTGVDSKNGHLVQLAWVLTDEDGNIESEKSHIIRPDGFRIPAGATRVHGITTEIAESKGRSLEDVLEEFSDDVDSADVVVAHNIGFDVRFLKSSFEKIYLDFSLDSKVQICTMKAAKKWCGLPMPSGKPGFKSPKLEELYQKLFGYIFDSAHDALADTKACMRCFFELSARNVLEHPMGSVNSLHTSSTTDLCGSQRKLEETKDRERAENDIELGVAQAELKLDLEPDMAHEDLNALLEDADSLLSLALAKHANADSALVDDALEQVEESDLYCALTDPALPEKVLLWLAKWGPDEFRSEIIQHPGMTEAVMRTVIENSPTFDDDNICCPWRRESVKDSDQLASQQFVFSILRNPHCPTSYLKEWAEKTHYYETSPLDEDLFVQAIVQNPRVTAEILAFLYWHVPYGGRTWKMITSGTDLPCFTEDQKTEALSSVLYDWDNFRFGQDHITLSYVLWPYCCPELLSVIPESYGFNDPLNDADKEFPRWVIKLLITQHPNTPRKTLRSLSGLYLAYSRYLPALSVLQRYRDKRGFYEVDTNGVVATNLVQELSVDDCDLAREAAAMHSCAGESLLSNLSNDKKPNVRKAVASNPKTPRVVLRQLAKDVDFGVRCAVAGSPRIDNQTFQILYRDPEEWIRCLVAYSEQCPDSVKIALCDDPNLQVRKALASTKDLPPKAVMKLVEDSSVNVLSALMDNDGFPKELKRIVEPRLNKQLQAIGLKFGIGG